MPGTPVEMAHAALWPAGSCGRAPLQMCRLHTMTTREVALTAGSMIVWVAAIYLMMASGVRLGELVWSGRQPRLLEPALRVRSFLFGLGLVASAAVVAFASGLINSPIPDRFTQFATFAAAAFLGLGCLYCLIAGSRWERMLFAPIMLLGAIFATWLTFA